MWYSGRAGTGHKSCGLPKNESSQQVGESQIAVTEAEMANVQADNGNNFHFENIISVVTKAGHTEIRSTIGTMELTLAELEIRRWKTC